MSAADRYGVTGRRPAVLVTGAASGIGRACALAFASDGCDVAVLDRDEHGEAVAAELRDAGGHAVFVAVDVAEEDSCRAAVDAAVDALGHLDCAVNAAGITPATEGLERDEWNADIFDRVVRVNLRGVVLSMKHELRHMVQEGRGAIVNVASGAGLIGVPGAVAYTGSKHGVVGATRAAALQYAATGIRINAICPGAVRTRMTAGMEDLQAAAHPIARLAEPEEMAGAARWLCSIESSFVLGAAVPVDGGYTAK